MKKIGIIGGMSMESTIHYCEKINALINSRLGGFNSAELVMVTVNFANIVECQNQAKWDEAGRMLNEAALSLEKAGADFIIMATNTMHKVAEQLMESVKIPFLHIAEATLEELKKGNIKKIGLLGTRFTMEQGFYKQILIDGGIDVIIPSSEDIAEINRIIFDELCKGEVKKSSGEYYRQAIKKMQEQGAEGVIYGCTEIEMLGKEISSLPVYNTTEIHVEKAVDKALA